MGNPDAVMYKDSGLEDGEKTQIKCPRCNDGYMVVRVNKQPNHDNFGEAFLGCENYKPDKSGCGGQGVITAATLEQIIGNRSRSTEIPEQANFLEAVSGFPSRIEVAFNPRIESLIIKLLEKLIGTK